MGSPEPLDPRFTGNVILLQADSRATSFPPHNLVSHKPLKFDSQYQLTGSSSAADTTDKKPAGFTPSGTPLQQLNPARQ